MHGKLITAMSKNREVRIYVAETTDMVERARAIHDLSPISAAAMGRTITAASMMGMMSKIEDEKLTLQIKGSGNIGLIIAIADTKGNIKSYMSNAHAETVYTQDGKLAVGDAIGKDGRVIVIRDLGMKEPFIGQSELVTGEIGDDIAHYFMQSEQQPTALGLGVSFDKTAHIKSAGGFLVQLLPETTEETISQIEANLSGMQSVTALLEEGLTIEQIAHQVMAGLGLDELEAYPLSYQCDCSEEKMKRGIQSIGINAIKDIIEEQGDAETVCHFCHTTYHFSKDVLEMLCKALEETEA